MSEPPISLISILVIAMAVSLTNVAGYPQSSATELMDDVIRVPSDGDGLKAVLNGCWSNGVVPYTLAADYSNKMSLF